MKLRRIQVIISVLSLLAMTGCSFIGTEEEYRIMRPARTNYENDECAVVLYGDLVKETVLLASVHASEESTLAFQVSGVNYDTFYAAKGDKVRKGELLARLDCGDYLKEQAKAQFEIERVKVRKEELDAQFLKGGVSAVDYGIESANLNTELQNLNQKLAECKQLIDERSIYADIDGYVSDMYEFDMTKKSEEGREIYDLSGGNMYFTANAKDPSGLEANKEYDISIGEDEIMGVRLTSMTENEEGKWDLILEPVDSSVDLTEITTGRMNYVQEMREDVLYLQKDAVVSVGDKHYVYYRNEDGLRESKEVEIDGEIDFAYIIKSGLTEGEEVLCK